MPYLDRQYKIIWRVIPLGVLLLMLFIGAASAFAATSSANNSNDQCLQCHGNKEFSIEQDAKTKSLYVDNSIFEHSVHGSNDCLTCHPGANNFPHPENVKIVKSEIDEACQTCHFKETKEYSKGVHANRAATCTDCHGSHDIEKLQNLSQSELLQFEVEICSNCHQGRILESYEESFHGKAVSLGSTKAASCVSCHGAHEILGPEDPASSVASANVPQTCATCHQEPQINFAAGQEHFVLEPEGPGKPMYYTYKFFTWLTIITITLLIIHIELELFKRYRNAGK